MGRFEDAAASCGVQLDPVGAALLGIVDEMLVEATGEVVAMLPEDSIRHALWVCGGSDYARQPGGFVERLFELCAIADDQNLDALLLAFPDDVMAWLLSREAGGVELLEHRLRQIEQAREEERAVIAQAFGLPFVPAGSEAAMGDRCPVCSSAAGTPCYEGAYRVAPHSERIDMGRDVTRDVTVRKVEDDA